MPARMRRALEPAHTERQDIAVAVDCGADRLYDFGAFFWRQIGRGIDLNMATRRGKGESGPLQ